MPAHILELDDDADIHMLGAAVSLIGLICSVDRYRKEPAANPMVVEVFKHQLADAIRQTAELYGDEAHANGRLHRLEARLRHLCTNPAHGIRE